MQSGVFGKSGEIISTNFLKKKGYKILATNYKNKIGEIDIIAQHKSVTVFVEVKARFSRAFGDPLEAIDERKQEKIKRIATLYMMKNKLMETNVRFDAISIIGKPDDYEIRHIENAF